MLRRETETRPGICSKRPKMEKLRIHPALHKGNPTSGSSGRHRQLLARLGLVGVIFPLERGSSGWTPTPYKFWLSPVKESRPFDSCLGSKCSRSAGRSNHLNRVARVICLTFSRTGIAAACSTTLKTMTYATEWSYKIPRAALPMNHATPYPAVKNPYADGRR